MIPSIEIQNAKIERSSRSELREMGELLDRFFAGIRI